MFCLMSITLGTVSDLYVRKYIQYLIALSQPRHLLSSFLSFSLSVSLIDEVRNKMGFHPSILMQIVFYQIKRAEWETENGDKMPSFFFTEKQALCSL